MGFTLRAPRSNAWKESLTGGSSVPAMSPSTLVVVRAPATIPAWYDASSKAKEMPARLGAVTRPEVMAYTVLGYCGATRAAASWNSKPWPMTRLYPCAPYCRKFSSNSAGVLVWMCEICAPSESRSASSP